MLLFLYYFSLNSESRFCFVSTLIGPHMYCNGTLHMLSIAISKSWKDCETWLNILMYGIRFHTNLTSGQVKFLFGFVSISFKFFLFLFFYSIYELFGILHLFFLFFFFLLGLSLVLRSLLSFRWNGFIRVWFLCCACASNIYFRICAQYVQHWEEEEIQV